MVTVFPFMLSDILLRIIFVSGKRVVLSCNFFLHQNKSTTDRYWVLIHLDKFLKGNNTNIRQAAVAEIISK